MAQDPASGEGLNSHALDMVTLPGSSVSNEMEADMIRGVLESNGIPAVVGAAAEFPNLGFEVKVPRGRLSEAERVLQEARATGPEAAVDAESETER
jgi:Putative prokaryotic signal transducing protein